MFDYQDTLAALDKNTSLSEKLCSIHNTLKQRYNFIDRIAVAIYDEKTDELKTFINSSGPDQPLTHYQSRLSDSKSLQKILKQGQPRVINDLAIFSNVKATHAQRLSSQGYQASYTMPMYANTVFIGFIFFNSYTKNPFDTECLHYLDLFGHLTSLLISNELSNFRTLISTLKATKHIAHFRDVETGAHLDRMSHYSRIIAQQLADKYNFSDEYIEHIFMFSPLHDVGKIGVPDKILLKPAELTDEEFETIKLHTSLGREIIDAIMQDFNLDSFKNIDMLRHITELHHEAIDGSGYPNGLKGNEIPIEARIISVADMFDALTSKRPYKERWNNDDAFAMLQKLAGTKLDKDCVQALLNRRTDVEKIQERFYENNY